MKKLELGLLIIIALGCGFFGADMADMIEGFLSGNHDTYATNVTGNTRYETVNINEDGKVMVSVSMSEKAQEVMKYEITLFEGNAFNVPVIDFSKVIYEQLPDNVEIEVDYSVNHGNRPAFLIRLKTNGHAVEDSDIIYNLLSEKFGGSDTNYDEDNGIQMLSRNHCWLASNGEETEEIWVSWIMGM